MQHDTCDVYMMYRVYAYKKIEGERDKRTQTDILYLTRQHTYADASAVSIR